MSSAYSEVIPFVTGIIYYASVTLFMDIMTGELISNILLTVPIVVAGLFMHELFHYLFGRIFGGGTFFSRYTFGIPTQIDFDSPYDMSDKGVRITGGSVLLFPVIALVGASFGVFPVFAFGLGGSAISMTDMMALQYPDVWKDFTAGESVSRSRIE